MTTAEEVSATTAAPTLNIHKADDYKSIYVNWVQSSLTPFDISLIIGEALAIGPSIFDVEHKARIIFNPAEAKVVAGMLAQSVELYEKQFGPVPVAHVTTNVIIQDQPTEKTEGD
jgi:hypothetical protein